MQCSFSLVTACYCTMLGENGCTDIVSHQLRDSSMVSQWCGQCTEGRINVQDGNRSGRSYLVTQDLTESVQQAVLLNLHFTILEFSGQFLQISRSLLHEIVSRWQENVSTTTAVTSWLQALAVDSYDTGIQTLLYR